jgi:O-acetyl-ADP-ribose deacetylase (regulator of RNase III)
VRRKKDFSVTQTDVLDAQVVVEAAHRSAVNGGLDYAIVRSENLDEYERLCQQHKLFDPEPYESASQHDIALRRLSC